MTHNHEHERRPRPEITSPREYYSNPAVSRAVLEFMGWNNPEVNGAVPSLTNAEPDISDAIREHVPAEYLSVSSIHIKSQKQGRIPARSVKPWTLPYVLARDPRTEIHHSFWQTDAPYQEGRSHAEKKPVRAMLMWDIEHYHKTYPGKALSDQLGTFELLEPVYGLMRERLQAYGLDYIAIMTGRGYHFVSQVPYTSDVMDLLIAAGNRIEPQVGDYQRSVPENSKRDRPIPPKVELAFKGATRLQQFLFNQVINEARRRSHIPVEISDRGEEGIALDNTSMVRHVGTAHLATLGSVYIKPFVKPQHFGEQVVNNTQLLTRIPRATRQDDFASLPDLIRIRQNLNDSAHHLGESGGQIPDGSAGIRRLVADYMNSPLRELHAAIDSEQGHPPEEWDETYRNYDGVIGNDHELRRIFSEGNPELLRPDSLNYLINTLFDRGGGHPSVAGHIRTLLRSAYEDPRFNWGTKFMRHDPAARHAEGWTSIILGQRLEEK